MRKTFKYRLFTTRTQSELLDVQLGEACRLYNAALQERREAWKQRVSINYYTQANQLKEIRAAGDLGLANFSCCQDILRRVNKTYEAFFRRVKRGEKAGYPRFKSRGRFDSITFPSYGDGIQLNDSTLRIQGIGQVEVKLHRPVGGKIKTVTVKRECGQWYACFSVECASKPLPASTNEIGMDVGLEKFATLWLITSLFPIPAGINERKRSCAVPNARLPVVRRVRIAVVKRLHGYKRFTSESRINVMSFNTSSPSGWSRTSV